MLFLRFLLFLQWAIKVRGNAFGVTGSVNTANYDVGTTPTQFIMQATFPVGVSVIGEKIDFEIVAEEQTGLMTQHSLLQSSFSLTYTITYQSVASDAVFSPCQTSTDGTHIECTLTGGTLVAGETVFLAISSGFQPFPATAPLKVTLRAESTNDPQSTPAFHWFDIMPLGFSGGLVSGDPVTYYNDKKQEFELPNDVFTTLIKMPDLDVQVRPLPRDGKKEQWIGRVVVTTTDEKADVVADVRIKRHIAWFNRTTAHENGFETLDVTLPWFVPYPKLHVLPPHDAYFSHPSGASVLVGRVRHQHKEFDMRAPRAEVVFVIGKYAKVVIFAASAHEYYGWSDYHGRRWAHLDVEIVNMRDQHLFEGVLPELWGIKPLTEEVRAMMKNSTDDEAVMLE